MTIRLMEEKDGKAWDSYANGHPEGTIYHTTAWKYVTEEGFGHRAHYLLAEDISGSIQGLLPLFFVDGIFGRRLVSLPMRDRGSVLATDPSVANELIASAIQSTQELDCKYLELKSLNNLDIAPTSLESLELDRNWITSRIDLTPGEEQLWRRLDKDAVRWAVKKASKNGIRVDEEHSERGVEIFYEMFVHTRCSMGIPPFPKHLFTAIWENIISKGLGNMFIAWLGNEPVNAIINLLSKDTLIAAYAAPQNQWRKYYPSDAIFWKTISWAANNGYRYCDFGANSAQQTSLIWYKKKWGAVQHPMFYYYYLNKGSGLPNFDSSSSSYNLMRQTWKLLPEALCKPLGSWVTRQLS